MSGTVQNLGTLVACATSGDSDRVCGRLCKQRPVFDILSDRELCGYRVIRGLQSLMFLHGTRRFGAGTRVDVQLAALVHTIALRRRHLFFYGYLCSSCRPVGS